jgi:hypothetical protein
LIINKSKYGSANISGGSEIDSLKAARKQHRPTTNHHKKMPDSILYNELDTKVPWYKISSK